MRFLTTIAIFGLLYASEGLRMNHETHLEEPETAQPVSDTTPGESTETTAPEVSEPSGEADQPEQKPETTQPII